jgi:hypothetical protein
MFIPVGRVPEATLQVYDPLPPVALSGTYACPREFVPRLEPVVIVRAADKPEAIRNNVAIPATKR